MLTDSSEIKEAVLKAKTKEEMLKVFKELIELVSLESLMKGERPIYNLGQKALAARHGWDYYNTLTNTEIVQFTIGYLFGDGMEKEVQELWHETTGAKVTFNDRENRPCNYQYPLDEIFRIGIEDGKLISEAIKGSV